MKVIFAKGGLKHACVGLCATRNLALGLGHFFGSKKKGRKQVALT